jgi:hypothetical protein
MDVRYRLGSIQTGTDKELVISYTAPTALCLLPHYIYIVFPERLASLLCLHFEMNYITRKISFQFSWPSVKISALFPRLIYLTILTFSGNMFYYFSLAMFAEHDE